MGNVAHRVFAAGAAPAVAYLWKAGAPYAPWLGLAYHSLKDIGSDIYDCWYSPSGEHSD